MEEDYDEENPNSVEEENPNPVEEENPNPVKDYQEMLDVMLALPGRQHLPLLFNRHKEKISRVIAGIFRRKFDGPYYSWKVTSIHIQERYFRTFSQKFYLGTGITKLVKDEFLKIAKKQMKSIVSQAKNSGKQPIWIRGELWAEMCAHWNEPDVIERSLNASQCRNSDRGGLGVHKHLADQKSYVQIHQEMEEELGRPISFAKQVAETYEKTLEEKLCEVDDDGPENSGNSSERSSHRTLSIEEKNDIFLKCSQTYEKGNLFGLGSLVETLRKGKRKEIDAEFSPSTPTLLELQEQLRNKIAHLDAENARLDKEHQESQMKTNELLIYMKEIDPGFETFIASLRPTAPEDIIPPATALDTTPATTSSFSIYPSSKHCRF
ncbi:PREDICTED: uncharacterized protein LOC104767907 [Camelina sativa]|uniref:Uncharacterized protein LOC104767907 n=1 Tax=Camelina sativa TaxID=90675 RepID=A0ABM0XS45_CAMSA|nr:PREDICTED: uncharacterized protein LOC104767907 [Camelina sativa]